ncbi:aspartate aminotransferase [Polyplosphaeria fusca]|uniref:Aspartate aminotransferase n=1 Tax=Polyplosphaeria fusca TaxID=682080 RepID=A0A9P4R9N4_9PLEO|nr:aspartate aminotransferase [Polyplosphaeria fusca]
MVKIETFSVEAWMDEWEHNCTHNIAETCCASISLDELRSLSDSKTKDIFDTSKALTYGTIRGSDELRSNLARLYSAKGPVLPKENIISTPGAIQANYLCAYALVGPGDHVICHYPTYQSLYSVPAHLGASVSLWPASPSTSWLPSLTTLATLIRPNTKLIIINNPHNPTGSILPKPFLERLIALASPHSIPILADEVYRPIFHSLSPLSPDFPPSLLSMGYEHAIVTGSMSKAYALAGIRVGWVASRSAALIERVASARHYTTISVSQLDEGVAAYALHADTVHGLLARNIQLAKTNLEILEKWVVKNEDECEWVRPVAGTTAFVKILRDGRPVDDVDFCEKLVRGTGVLFVPGRRCFGEEFKGYVRIGFVCETEVLREGLQKVTQFLRKEIGDVKFAE